MGLKDYIIDRYRTWRTGKDKPTREWEAWYETNVNYRANTIPNMFMHFKHIIVVDPNKFFQPDPFAWVPCDDAKQYFWPQCDLGNNAVWRFERVIWDSWDNCWYINDMGNEDKVFVATNNDDDALMISLRYT
jgi:hypothetical protein